MKEKNVLQKIRESKKYIEEKCKTNPKTAIICGSGLSNIKDIIEQKKIIPYSKIPYFKQSTVEGHTGELVLGKIKSADVILLNGRVHYYEGYTMQDISYPIRVMNSGMKGSKNPRAKISEETAMEIRVRYSEGESPTKLAKEYSEKYPIS